MPEKVSHPGDIQPGDVFEGCSYHPCFCYDVSDDHEHVFGISLVDGSTIQCNIFGCVVRKLTRGEAWRWKSQGPSDVELESKSVRANSSSRRRPRSWFGGVSRCPARPPRLSLLVRRGGTQDAK